MRSGTPRRQRASAAIRTKVRYLESSAVVAALLERDSGALKRRPAATRLVTSALTLAEAARAIVRARVAGRVTPAEGRAAVRKLQMFASRSFVLDVDRAVLARVGQAFPIEPVRTLDAVHLASVESLGVSPSLVTVVTRDDRVRDNAVASGYAVE